MVKGRPRYPTRTCRNRVGPGDVSRMSPAMRSTSGTNGTRNAALPTMSRPRLSALVRRCVPRAFAELWIEEGLDETLGVHRELTGRLQGDRLTLRRNALWE